MSDKRLSQRALRELGIAEDQIAADNKAAVTLAALLHQPCEERWTDKRGDTHIQVTMHGPDAHMQEAARLIAAGVTLAAAYAPLDVAAPLDEFGNPAYADDATNWAYEAGRRTGRAEPRAIAEPKTLDPWERLGVIESHLNVLCSDGPFMDTLTSERGWTEPADPILVRVYAAIIEASNAIAALEEPPT